VGLFLGSFASWACPLFGGRVVSGADWFSFLNDQDAICLFLLMSLLRTFSTGWVVFGTYLNPPTVDGSSPLW